VRTSAPTTPLSAALGFRFADGSLPQAMKRSAGGGCRPHIPASRCARLVLQTARYRGQRNALHPARALANSYRDHGAAPSFSRLCTNKMAVEIVATRTGKVAYTASFTILVHRSRALCPPLAPSRSSKTPPLAGPRRGLSQARHPQQSHQDVVITIMVR
jgi:hypothetical protein